MCLFYWGKFSGEGYMIVSLIDSNQVNFTNHFLESPRNVLLMPSQLDSPSDEFKIICLKRAKEISERMEGVKKYFQQAKAAAKKIKIFKTRSRALLTVVKVEARFSIKLAKETMTEIEDSEIQYLAQLEIVIVEAQKNISEAKRTAESIKDKDWQSLAYLEIVKVEAWGNVAEARKTVVKIKDPDLRSEALQEVKKAEMRDMPPLEETMDVEIGSSEVLLEAIKKKPLVEARKILETLLPDLQSKCLAHKAHLILAQRLNNETTACVAYEVIVPPNQEVPEIIQLLITFLEG